MDAILTIVFFATLLYLFVQFARQECIQDEYEEAIFDIEGRLDWARTRRVFPFGMTAQLEVAGELLGRAKDLWQANQWQKAYLVALQSQEAMNRAQSIYSSVIIARQRRAAAK
ncbi:hypothetical protein [Desulfopila sp. IMCC35008]|uniref:hypothetical protein n=1 Tax=Desulfopila sp. IMCC35008 TaxID=2653858 RepID=UPI0013D60AA2|nr:hypothetical protein [Desulfopila sp. IMCC35008]